MAVKASLKKKLHKSKRFEYRVVRNGRKSWGDICYYPDGKVIYWAVRESMNLYRKLDCWALDTATIAELRIYGVKYIGVRVLDTGDLYLTTFANFTDPAKGAMKLRDSATGANPEYIAKFGDRWQYYCPRSNMARIMRTREERAMTMAELMKV